MVRKCKLEGKGNNVVTVTNNNVKYYENLAKQYSDVSKEFAIKSEERSKEALLLANSHIENNENPHEVTAEQVGAFSKAEIQEMLVGELAKKNPNLVAGDNISIENNEDGTQTIDFSDAASIDYEILENKPSINDVLLVGNKTSSDLGLASIEDVPTKMSDLENDSGYLNQHQDISHLATKNELVEGLGQKQNELSTAQLSAINSGITSELVSKIEDVNNGLLTIQKDGETVGTFSANSSENKIINIESFDLEGVCNTALSNLSDAGKKVIDGQWGVVTNTDPLSTAKSVGNYEVDVSNHIPTDEYNYEVLVTMHSYRSSTSTAEIYISNEYFPRTKVADANSGVVNNTFLIPVGLDRKIIFEIKTQSLTAGNLTAIAYRRIGTNS